jgi:hypothetical protein
LIKINRKNTNTIAQRIYSPCLIQLRIYPPRIYYGPPAVAPHPAHPPSPPSQPTPPPAHPPFLFRFTSPSRSQLGSGSRSQLGPGAVAVGRPVPERTRTQVSGRAGCSGQGPGAHACSCWAGEREAGGAELNRRGRPRATDSEGSRRLRRAGGETKRLDSGGTAAHSGDTESGQTVLDICNRREKKRDSGELFAHGRCECP